MDSHTLKTEAMCWLRYGKSMDMVCTEAGKWNADILGLCETYSVEVEVKTSKQDLLREFTGKPAKHALYKAVTEGGRSYSVPNYFYFYVPESLEKDAVAIVSEKMPNAGVAVYVESWYRMRDGDKTRVAKKPKKLHGNKPTTQMQRAVLRRMGSELCGRHVAWRELVKDNALLDLESLAKSVSEAIAALPQTPDFDTELT